MGVGSGSSLQKHQSDIYARRWRRIRRGLTVGTENEMEARTWGEGLRPGGILDSQRTASVRRGFVSQVGISSIRICKLGRHTRIAGVEVEEGSQVRLSRPHPLESSVWSWQ